MGVAVVTGANRGIGLELCRQLASRGDKVIALCRRSSPELDALGVQVEAGVDVTDEGSIVALRRRLSDKHIDLLINNAGVGSRMTLDEIDASAIKEMFAVNAVGPLLVSSGLLPLMGAGGKIAIITSRMGSIGDNDSGGWYSYRMSKAAVNAAGVSLARDLRSQGIAVAILHPGTVQTDMLASIGATGMPPAESVQGLLARLDELTLQTTGQLWHGVTGELLPW